MTKNLYRIKIVKEQRKPVKKRHPNLAKSKVYLQGPKWYSAKDHSHRSKYNLKKLIKRKMESFSSTELPKSHEIEEKEEIQLIKNYNTEEPIFQGKIKLKIQKGGE